MPARAALTDGRGGLRLDTIEVAAPAAGEVRVRLHAAGLCRTDLDALGWGYAQVLGHEGAGVVVDVGTGVVGLAGGDAVLLNWAVPCGRCRPCSHGHAALCERTQGHGSMAHAGGTTCQGDPMDRMFTLGTLAELALVRAEAVTPIPSSLPAAHACILGCAVLTGVGSVLNVARVGRGDSVAVIGCGGVGLSVVQGARIAEAGRIIAIDANPARLAAARALGATDTVLAGTGDAALETMVATVLAMSDGRGADHAFEASGVPGLAFAPLRVVRNGGTAVQLSGPVGDVGLDTASFAWNKRFVMPLYGDCVPARDVPILLAHHAAGRLDLATMVTRRYRLDDLHEAFDDLRAARCIKGVVDLVP